MRVKSPQERGLRQNSEQVALELVLVKLAVDIHIENACRKHGGGIYCTIVEEILSYAAYKMRELKVDLSSTQDVDNYGDENKYFIWTSGEIHAVQAEEFESFTMSYDI